MNIIVEALSPEELRKLDIAISEASHLSGFKLVEERGESTVPHEALETDGRTWVVYQEVAGKKTVYLIAGVLTIPLVWPVSNQIFSYMEMVGTLCINAEALKKNMENLYPWRDKE